MTEKLKTLMDRASDIDFAPVDLDAITSAGDRIVRRRRVSAGAAGLAAAAVTAGAVVLVAGDDGPRRSDFVDSPFRSEVPTWTVGSTLHTSEGTYELGVDVVTYIRTSEGIVFVGLDNGVYSYTGGQPEKIGETEDWRVVGDPDSPYAGFLDTRGREVVVYDQEAGEEAWRDSAEDPHAFPFIAIDGSTAYLREIDRSTTRALDLRSGELTALPDGPDSRNLLAVRGDLFAYHRRGEVVVGSAGDSGVTLEGDFSEGAVFSPDGRWISVFGDTAVAYDTATGEPVPLDVGHRFGLGYQWLDGDTLLAIAGEEEPGEIALLTCDVPAGTCSEVSSLPGFESERAFAIAFGEAVWGPGAEKATGSEPAPEMRASDPPATSGTEQPE